MAKDVDPPSSAGQRNRVADAHSRSMQTSGSAHTIDTAAFELLTRHAADRNQISVNPRLTSMVQAPLSRFRGSCNADSEATPSSTLHGPETLPGPGTSQSSAAIPVLLHHPPSYPTSRPLSSVHIHLTLPIRPDQERMTSIQA